MNEKGILIIVILSTLTVALVGLGGMYVTGSAVVSRSCECVIERFDTYGHPIEVQVQPIRVKTQGALTNEACDNRCATMFGRGTNKQARYYGELDTKPGLG